MMTSVAVSPGVALGIIIVMLVGFVGFVWLAGYASKRELLQPTAQLVAAPKSQRWWSLACSFYAAGFGASALVANPEAGAVGGFLLVFIYGLANGLPYFVLAILGPRINSFLGDFDGFTIADFVYKRFGVLLFVPTIFLSVGFMFIWLTAELTSVADGLSLISPDLYNPAGPLVVAFGVALYALFAGFKGSIFTDRIQATAALTLLIAVAICIFSHVPVESGAFQHARVIWPDNLWGAVVIITSTAFNQFLDLGSWQRVFAGEDHRQARIGLVIAGVVNMLCQGFMAFLGMYALGASFRGIIELDQGDEALGFYRLIGACSLPVNILGLIFLILLAISTVDSIENSFAASFAHLIIRSEKSLNWSRLLALSLIAASVALACTKQSVLSLFLLSNIFSCCIVPPIFLGLSKRFASRIGAFTGFALGVLCIFLIGWAHERTFVGGITWPMFPAGFSGASTALTFIVCPIVATVGTIAVSMWFPDAPSFHSSSSAGDTELVASPSPVYYAL